MQALRECVGGPLDGEFVSWPTSVPIRAVPLRRRAAQAIAMTPTPASDLHARCGYYSLLVEKNGVRVWSWEGEEVDPFAGPST